MHIPSKNECIKRDFDKSECMSFLIKDEKLLEKYNKIWKKFNNSIKKEFDSKPVYNRKYLKIIVKSYNRKINTNFRNDKVIYN